MYPGNTLTSSSSFDDALSVYTKGPISEETRNIVKNIVSSCGSTELFNAY